MLRLIFEKILKGEKLNDNERAFFLQWAEKAASLQVPPPQQVTIVEQNLTPLQSVVIREVENYVKSRGFITQISEITDKLGLVRAGEFRSGNDQAPGDNFTGIRIGYPGFDYESETWVLAGVEDDTLQVGISLTDGKLYAGGGAVVLDEDGITSIGGTIAGWDITATTIEKHALGVGIWIDSANTQIRIGDEEDHIVLDGANQLIKSSNFVSGVRGSQWSTATGDAEFNNLVARGELRTFLLTSEHQMAVGGRIMVSKASGKLAATASSGISTMDFGQAMTVGDWVKFEGNDNSGNNAVEWVLVDSLVSGNVYNVTRDVDGSGANTWGADTPFAVIGANGDSRIEMTSGATASLQLITQGATWDAQTVQASMSTVEGAIVAGAGTVHIDTRGVVIDNAAPSLIFEDSAGNADTVYINAAADDDLEITNLVGPISLVVKTTDASLPRIAWEENPSTANATSLSVEPGSAGGRAQLFSAFDFDTRSGSKQVSFFSELVYDGGTEHRLEIGSDHYFPTRNSSNKTGYWNEANQSGMHFIFEGTSGDVLKIDADNNRAEISTLLVTNGIKAENNSNDIFRVDNPGGTSLFIATINGAPSGTSVVYNAPSSGTEAAIVPASTSQLAKLRLYNTTRSNSALISDCNTGTNTITLTATVPANWASGDTITIASQTVSGGASDWIDLEITSALTGKTSIQVITSITSATVGNRLRLHPTDTFAVSKGQTNRAVVASQPNDMPMLVAVTSNLFSLEWNGTPSTIAVREVGYLQ